MSDPAFKTMSVEEYLRTEAISPVKREYVGGFVYALHGQAGASGDHARISLKIGAALISRADELGCRVYAGEMKLYSDERGSYYYPDVMVACGERPDKYYETSPCLLVEVLSKSTASIDRIGKYGMYTSIPSLQTYLIVEQEERRVYAYQKSTDGTWPMQELTEGTLSVPCLGFSLSLDQIYGGVL